MTTAALKPSRTSTGRWLRRILSPIGAPVHRRLRRALALRSRRAVILTYHRVARLPHYPYRIVVDPDRFEQHMSLLKTHFHVIELMSLVAAVEANAVPPRSVVVTFDDGYADVLENAIPVLVSHAIPATLFVISGAIGAHRERWWDRSERVAFAATRVGLPLILDGGAAGLRWEVGEKADPRELLNRIHRSLLPLPEPRRHDTLDCLFAQLGLDASPRPEHRFMTSEELTETALAPGIEIGAHTVSHPLLSALPAEEQGREMKLSRQRLQELTGGDITAFAYPNGGVGTYTRETVREVADAGFSVACTTFHRPVVAGTPLLELPRCSVHDWAAEEFRRRLEGLFMIQPLQGTTDSKGGAWGAS